MEDAMEDVKEDERESVQVDERVGDQEDEQGDEREDGKEGKYWGSRQVLDYCTQQDQTVQVADRWDHNLVGNRGQVRKTGCQQEGSLWVEAQHRILEGSAGDTHWVGWSPQVRSPGEGLEAGEEALHSLMAGQDSDSPGTLCQSTPENLTLYAF